MARKTKKQTDNPKVPKGSRWWRWSNLAHLSLNISLPIALLVLVNINLELLAIIIALFSKWRVFTVRPRHLIANLRANFTDIFVKLGTLAFIIQADTNTAQLAWTAWYIIWLTLIKPQSSKIWMGLQAMAGQVIGLSALFQFSESLPPIMFLALVWLIATGTARHLLANYEDEWSRVIVLLWGLFVTELAWLSYHWLLVYLFVPQLVLILAVISYTLASIYDAAQKDTLERSFVRQQAIVATVTLAAIVMLGDWHGEI